MANGRIIIDVLLDAADAIKSTGKVKDAFVGMGKVLAGAAVMGAGAIAGIVESTAELNQDLARLKANANSAGFGFEVMEDGMKKVAAVTGEMDSAVETMSNLMATDFSENQLSEALDYINGAAIKFSDTLKTEGIADGLQETFATGEAIGMFGELLERSGVDLDVFNKGLAQAAKNGTETDYVLQQLSELGLSSVYDEYKAANPEIFAYNEASTNLQVALAELGKTFTPLVTGSKQFLTSIIDLINGNKTLDQVIDDIVIKFADMLSAMTGIDASVFINAFETVKTTVLGIMDTIEDYIASGLARIKGYWASEGDSLIATVHSKLTEMQAVVLPIVQGVIDTLSNLFKSVQVIWERDGQAIIERLVTIFNSIKEIVVPIVEDAIQLIIDNFAKIKAFWDANGEQILQAVSNVFKGILAVIEFVMPAVQFVVEYVWNAIKNIFTGALDVIMGAVKVFSGLFTGDWSKMWEGIKQTLSGAVDLILGIMSLTFIGGIRTALVNLGKTATSLIKGMWDDIAKLFTGAGNAIANTVSKMATAVVNFFKNIWTQGSNIFGTLKTFGASTFNALKQAVTTTVSGLVTSVVRSITNLKTNFINLISSLKTNVTSKFQEIKDGIIDKVKSIDLMQIGKDIVSGLINGVGAMFVNVKTKIEELASLIPEWAKKILGIHSPSRVMKEVGKWTGEGLAMGVEGTKKTNQKAITDLTKVIIDVTKKNSTEVSKIATEAEKERTKIQQSYATKRSNMKKTDVKKVQQLETEMHAKLKEVNEKAWAEMVKKEGEVSQQKLEAIKQYIDGKKKMNELSLVEEAQYWRTSYQHFKTGSAENIELRQAYQDNVKRINDAITNVNNTFVAEAKRIDDEYLKGVEAANKRYDDAYNARYVLAMNAYGLFEKVAAADPVSKYDLTSNLQGQVTNLQSWADQIKQLSNRKVSKDLLNELQGMGPKALEELKALNSMTSAELTQYSELYDEKSKAARQAATDQLKPMKEDITKEIEAMQSAANAALDFLNEDWQKAIKEVVKGTDTELKTLHQVGKNAGKGLLEGLSSMESSLNKKAKSMAESLKQTIEKALDINSPSKWMRDEIVGKGLTGGFEVGIEKNTPTLLKAAAEMGELLKPDLKLVNPLRNVKLDLGLDKPSTSTSNISNIYNNYGQKAESTAPVIQPAPIYLDGQKIADVIFEAVGINTSNSVAIKRLVKGV